ncbi:MAG: hypothetical protein AAF846_16665 [Chloroflexota bacterium]
MRFIKELPMLVIIFFSWSIITLFLAFMNLLILVPWDVALYLPDVGTWQRTLNDFFSSQTGYFVIYAVVSILTSVPLIETLSRHWYANIRIIIATLLTVFVGYFLMIASFSFNNIIFPYTGSVSTDPFEFHGYHRSIIPLLTIWLLYGVWTYKIRKLGNYKQKNKLKNQSGYLQAMDRLVDTKVDTLFSSQDTLPPSQKIKTQ